jgi:hypothetical protein
LVIFCSVGFTGKTAKGTQKYVCKARGWVKTGATADVYSPDGSKLGSYRSVYNQKTHAVTYFWTIINSGGDALESGSSSCGLQGEHL